MALVTKSFSDIITFTRASTATYFDSAGVLTSASNNIPRFDYNPATLAARGLLIEEARTNLSTNSVLASAWGAASNASYANTQALAPDGTNTAWKLTEDLANSSHYGSMVNISTTYTSGTTYTVSRFLKASGRNVVTVYLPATNFATPGRVAFFNLTTGVVVSTDAGVTATIQNVGNGWYRCSASAVANATGSGHVGGSALTNNGVDIYQGDGVSGAFVWGHQLEAGAFPTSYIPTTTTALTRSADVASVNTLSPWFNATASTVYFEGTVATVSDSQNPYFWSIGDNTKAFGAREQIAYTRNTSSAQTVGLVAAGGATNASVASSNTAVTANTVFKAAASYAANDVKVCVNGLTPATTASATLPTGLNTLKLGAPGWSAAPVANAFYIRRFTYYPRSFVGAELQAITTP